MFEIGFKFKPTFSSNIDFFEVRVVDKKRDIVLTIVHSKDGLSFNDKIERNTMRELLMGDYVAKK